MRGHRAPRRRGEDTGFTLVELLVVISILGIIGYPLTESVILGLKTTDATAASSSRSVTTQTLSSYVTGDVQSADTVSTTDAVCAKPVFLSATETVFLSLAWADQAETRTVSYSLDPATGPEQELIRRSCLGSDGDPDRKILGQFSRNPDPTAPAVTATCDGAEAPLCPPTPSDSPARITLNIQSDPGVTLTVERRRTPP